MSNLIKNFRSPVIYALIGAVLMVAFLRVSPHSAQRILGNSTAATSAPADTFHTIEDQNEAAVEENAFDPFAQMEKMQKEMQKQLRGNLNVQTFSNVGGNISEREDDQFLFFDVNVSDPKGTEIRTEVSNGYLTIHGQTKSKHGDDQSWIQSSFSSSFSQSFPVPDSVDVDKLEMVQEKDKIVIRIPKVKI